MRLLKVDTDRLVLSPGKLRAAAEVCRDVRPQIGDSAERTDVQQDDATQRHPLVT